MPSWPSASRLRASFSSTWSVVRKWHLAVFSRMLTPCCLIKSSAAALTWSEGASDQVKAAAEDLIKQHGVSILLKTAKCHFRTTDQVLEKLALKREALGQEGMVKSKPFTYRPK